MCDHVTKQRIVTALLGGLLLPCLLLFFSLPSSYIKEKNPGWITSFQITFLCPFEFKFENGKPKKL